MNILLTGCAGFIGSHTVRMLLDTGHYVIGVDNFDPFYSREIKNKNIERIINSNFELIEGDLADNKTFKKIDFSMGQRKFDLIIHLAAKAGVRPSIENPLAYQKANVMGTQNTLDYAKERNIKKFIFGSSSSVYGESPSVPFKEDSLILNPISPYATTKLSSELLGHVYSKLFNIQFIALRFFTVYGPHQRPDLAISKFIKNISSNQPITVFGDGATSRDYTYIDDIVSGIIRSIDFIKTNYEIFNLGNDNSITLFSLIKEIENCLGIKAKIKKEVMQPGDVTRTWADITKAKTFLNYDPKTKIKDGLQLQIESMK